MKRFITQDVLEDHQVSHDEPRDEGVGEQGAAGREGGRRHRRQHWHRLRDSAGTRFNGEIDSIIR